MQESIATACDLDDQTLQQATGPKYNPQALQGFRMQL
jgi:hypothetical protein